MRAQEGKQARFFAAAAAAAGCTTGTCSFGECSLAARNVPAALQ